MKTIFQYAIFFNITQRFKNFRALFHYLGLPLILL